jgi:hypothetical protein
MPVKGVKKKREGPKEKSSKKWIDKNYLNSSESPFIILAETKIRFANMFQIFLDHFVQMG